MGNTFLKVILFGLLGLACALPAPPKVDEVPAPADATAPLPPVEGDLDTANSFGLYFGLGGSPYYSRYGYGGYRSPYGYGYGGGLGAGGFGYGGGLYNYGYRSPYSYYW